MIINSLQINGFKKVKYEKLSQRLELFVYHSCIVRSFDTQNELNNLQNEDSVIGYDWLWHTLTTISISEYVRDTL